MLLDHDKDPGSSSAFCLQLHPQRNAIGNNLSNTTEEGSERTLANPCTEMNHPKGFVPEREPVFLTCVWQAEIQSM